jgi:hypothetical protein
MMPKQNGALVLNEMVEQLMTPFTRRFISVH